MAKDTLVKCDVCGKSKKVDFGYCLSNGWPECCGYTMRMIKSDANVEKTMTKLLDKG